MCDAARKACIALDCSDENDPDQKQDLATSLKVWVALNHAMNDVAEGYLPLPCCHISLQASFDREYHGTWNVVVSRHPLLSTSKMKRVSCILTLLPQLQVGSDFGASITHELSRIIFFAIESEPLNKDQNLYILIFQQTDSGYSGAVETDANEQMYSPATKTAAAATSL